MHTYDNCGHSKKSNSFIEAHVDFTIDKENNVMHTTVEFKEVSPVQIKDALKEIIVGAINEMDDTQKNYVQFSLADWLIQEEKKTRPAVTADLVQKPLNTIKSILGL